MPELDKELKVDQCWYVRLPGARALTDVRILELTEYTVLLSYQDFSSPAYRYEFEDVHFIECYEDVPDGD